jgi:hypothetical protein
MTQLHSFGNAWDQRITNTLGKELEKRMPVAWQGSVIKCKQMHIRPLQKRSAQEMSFERLHRLRNTLV